MHESEKALFESFRICDAVNSGSPYIGLYNSSQEFRDHVERFYSDSGHEQRVVHIVINLLHYIDHSQINTGIVLDVFTAKDVHVSYRRDAAHLLSLGIVPFAEYHKVMQAVSNEPELYMHALCNYLHKRKGKDTTEQISSMLSIEYPVNRASNDLFFILLSALKDLLQVVDAEEIIPKTTYNVSKLLIAIAGRKIGKVKPSKMNSLASNYDVEYSELLKSKIIREYMGL